MPDHAISRLHAILLASLISGSYVLSVFVSLLLARPRSPLWRNDPVVIRTRSVLATASTCLCCVLVYLTIRSRADGKSSRLHTTLEYLGVPVDSPTSLFDPWKAFLIVPALFLGPLYVNFLNQSLPFQQNWNFKRDLVSRFSTWEGFRNYIMAPVTEEVTYRACILSIYKLAGFNRNTMIWLVPCWFSLAHIHHVFEGYKRLGKTSAALRRALITTLFQFVYTTIFGWLCSFLFLRTGSIFVPISAHTFCNIMGFPEIAWELRQFPSHRISIVVAYLSGVALFAYSLFPWSFNRASVYWTK